MAWTDNLVSAWKLDEDSGNAVDSFGSNTLTANGSPGTTAGKIGNARSFTAASSQYFSKASNSSLAMSGTDYTISFWAYLNSVATSMQMVTKYSNASNEYAVFLNGGKFAFFSGTAFSSVTANTFGSASISTWYHVLADFTTATNTISIRINNGTADTAVITPVSGTANFNLGYRDDGGTQYLDGAIDEVAIWKRLLTANERAALASGQGYPWFQPWILDENN